MQSKIVSRRIIPIAIFTGFIALSPVFFVYFFPKLFIHSGSAIVENSIVILDQKQTNPFSEQKSYGLPMRLRIPKINTDSLVEHVGLDSQGAIGVPKDRDNVAWFEFGQRPGDVGGAIIVGHYGINNKKTSVFDNLHRLRVGDKLFVEDDRGTIITFVVREIRRYDPEADSSVAFGPNDGKSHLNLITCEGVWDEKTQQYPKRLIVFTDKE